MVGSTACGAYVPLHRLGRQAMGQAWGIPAVPGERSVANADEDSLTMAVTASQECLVGQDPANIDAVYFATTTSPYTEKPCASITAAALLLLPKAGGATIRAAKSVSSEMLGQWRRSGDRYVRAFEPKLETEYAYVRSVAQGGKAALQEAGVAPKELATGVT